MQRKGIQSVKDGVAWTLAAAGFVLMIPAFVIALPGILLVHLGMTLEDYDP